MSPLCLENLNAYPCQLYDPLITTVVSSLSERLCPVQSFAMATEDDYGAANGADLMDGTPRIALQLTSRNYKNLGV